MRSATRTIPGEAQILAQIRGLRPLDEIHVRAGMRGLEGAGDGLPERALAGRE